MPENCIILHRTPNFVQVRTVFESPMRTVRLAIMASGSGSNAENIIRFFSTENRVEIGLIISNRAEAQVHQRAERLGIPSLTLSSEMLADGNALVKKFREWDIDFIVLAGYLLKVPAALISAYSNRIINIHPALLPKYGGRGMYGHHVHQAVVNSGDKESGITIHLVNENYDEGSIIFQAKCPVNTGDSADDVAARVHELEYTHYPEIISQVLKKEFSK